MNTVTIGSSVVREYIDLAIKELEKPDRNLRIVINLLEEAASIAIATKAYEAKQNEY